jgi:hypothetical protein
MSQAHANQAGPVGTVTREDLVRLVGALDERKTLDILALKPTSGELEEAAIWATGDGDVLAKMGRPLAGLVAQIVDILTVNEEEPPAVR